MVVFLAVLAWALSEGYDEYDEAALEREDEDGACLDDVVAADRHQMAASFAPVVEGQHQSHDALVLVTAAVAAADPSCVD